MILPITLGFSTRSLVQAASTPQFGPTQTVVIVAVLIAGGLFAMATSQRIHYRRTPRNGDPPTQAANRGDALSNECGDTEQARPLAHPSPSD